MTSRPGTPWPNTATTSPTRGGVVHGVEGDRPDAGEHADQGVGRHRKHPLRRPLGGCHVPAAVAPHAVDEVVDGDAADPGADLDDASDLFVTPAVEWVRVRGVTVDV